MFTAEEVDMVYNLVQRLGPLGWPTPPPPQADAAVSRVEQRPPHEAAAACGEGLEDDATDQPCSEGNNSWQGSQGASSLETDGVHVGKEAAMQDLGELCSGA
jgi:hypothetical protein